MGILHAIISIFQPATFTYLVLGVLLGVFVGAMPGLTATLAVAILTPLTFWLPPSQGLAMLIGVYNSAIFAGGISAILINTPGTPASIATTWDGYALSKKGMAGIALSVNSIYSVFGGLFSSLILAVISFPLAEFALKFGPSEYFALAIFGLSMMVSVSGKSIVKGLLVGVMGLALATVGLDPMLSYPRYTFGITSLLNGFSFIPIMIGLFGLGEVFYQIFESHDVKSVFTKTIGRLFPTWEQIKRMNLPALLSAIIGVVIGAIPGTGGDIASIISWDQAKKISKHKEEFGKGSVEGLAATCVANNAVIGGAMTTMLTLGLPGDAPTAILIGALMMYGHPPGPALFRDYPDFVWTIIGLMFVANLVILPVGILGSRIYAKTLTLSKPILWSIIIIFSIIGSYGVSNNPMDLWVVFVAGIFGFIFRKLEFPLGPVILALILGPMAEANLRRALIISHGRWSVFVTHPISLTLLILSALALILPLIKQKKKEMKEDGT